MALKTTQFVAMVLVALALVPAGAHLFEMPHKIGMTQEQYFTVQAIYRGWALFGIALIGAIVAMTLLAFMLRDQPLSFWLAVVTLVCLAAGLAVFFGWIYPANQVTRNWTVAPANWAELRTQWEYSHAVNAVLNFTGFCTLVLSVLTTAIRPE